MAKAKAKAAPKEKAKKLKRNHRFGGTFYPAGTEVTEAMRKEWEKSTKESIDNYCEY